MASLQLLVFLAAVLYLSSGQDPSWSSLSTEDPEVQREIVDKHNALRRQASPPASNMLRMEWSHEAAQNAEAWANQCHLQHSAPEDRQTDIHCGENLYMSGHPDSWSQAIQHWYDEVHDFVHGEGKKFEDAVVGHYTQVVWYKSHQVGCAVAYCPNEHDFKYFYVCQYCPAGNEHSSINEPYLKGTPCDSCEDACDNGLCTNPCKHVNKWANCEDLKNSVTCDHPIVQSDCEASCKCTTEIK
ncbi:cysteine-rich secretory protein 2-like [Tachyglossus aculeatus]|uniref:cysteine-rich secretory protein 2-like n=1 Tax=Tachyglossus aculeatus TaxID=9261 RepID=UPI0018F6B03C|nr:cysteine-rich secretory protein 2-like [Tachyglossus aculeatus]